MAPLQCSGINSITSLLSKYMTSLTCFEMLFPPSPFAEQQRNSRRPVEASSSPSFELRSLSTLPQARLIARPAQPSKSSSSAPHAEQQKNSRRPVEAPSSPPLESCSLPTLPPQAADRASMDRKSRILISEFQDTYYLAWYTHILACPRPLPRLLSTTVTSTTTHLTSTSPLSLLMIAITIPCLLNSFILEPQKLSPRGIILGFLRWAVLRSCWSIASLYNLGF